MNAQTGMHTGPDQPIFVGFHQDFQQWFLYVYAGIDPHDGCHQEQARRATPLEVKWFRQGRIKKLMRRLEEEGVPPVVADRGNPVGWAMERLRNLFARRN